MSRPVCRVVATRLASDETSCGYFATHRLHVVYGMEIPPFPVRAIFDAGSWLETLTRCFVVLSAFEEQAPTRQRFQKALTPTERLDTRQIGTDQIAAPIMETSQEFRTFSKQCDRLAEEAETKNERRILKELAVAWERVAEEYERKQLLGRH